MKRMDRLLLSLLLAGCATADGADGRTLSVTVPAVSEGFSRALLQATRTDLHAGHSVRLLLDEQELQATEQAVREARRSVHIEMLIWGPGEASDRLLAILRDRAEAIECRVLVDALGSRDFDEALRRKVEAAGCRVRVFRPLGDKDSHDMFARLHRKLVIVDGEVALTGGFGIDDQWLKDRGDDKRWRDTSVIVRGPVVRDMQAVFARDWLEAGGDLLPEEDFPKLPSGGAARAGFVSSSGRYGPTNAEHMSLLVAGAARTRLWLAVAYFAPSEAILERLEDRARAGVDVRLMLPGPVNDIVPFMAAQRAVYKRLLSAGVRVWEYQPAMMHAKTMLVDDRLSVIGSTNFDRFALDKFEEGSLVVDDGPLAAALAQSFELDMTRAKEMTLDDHPDGGVFGWAVRATVKFLAR